MKLRLPKKFIENTQKAEEEADNRAVRWVILCIVCALIAITPMVIGIVKSKTYRDKENIVWSTKNEGYVFCGFLGTMLAAVPVSIIITLTEPKSEYNMSNCYVCQPYNTLRNLIPRLTDEMADYEADISATSSSFSNGRLYNKYTIHITGYNKIGGFVEETIHISDNENKLNAKAFLNGDWRFLDNVKFGKKQFAESSKS